MTIDATAATVSFTEPSGRGTFTVNGKTAAMEISGSKIKAKTKWDHAALKQELSTLRRIVVRSWAVDASEHLTLTIRVEGVMMSLRETRAVFDRQ